MNRLAVLFVDDEPRILEGIGRMLRGMRDLWDMRFANDGAAALRELERAPANVVVTDMRMPGMTGADLLEQVKSRWPETVRIVLSGQTDRALVNRVVQCAHQCLGKPCAPDLLRSTIERSCALRALVADPAIRRLAGAVEALPSVPAVYDDLMAVIADENASVADAAAIVARDPAMSAKLLQVVNSAFFGLGRKISHPGDAATLLGFDALRALVLTANAFQSLSAGSALADELWRHAMEVSGACRLIARAERLDRSLADHAFMAGMLHDAGQLLYEQRMPGTYAHLVRASRDRGVRLDAAEEALLHVSHASLGGYLLSLWGLPDAIIEAVAFHHSPLRGPVPALGALAILHVADGLVEDPSGASLDTAYLAAVGTSDRVPAWTAAIAEAKAGAM
ncbi:MAG: HDOD domain-containing protein [Planctomycetes bacterium]|nr:HDOD domain-containing protein [Planctomycetota bacterium]